MRSVSLQEYRCQKCHRMLFKGVVGMGFIEAKCVRCGEVSLIHSFDHVLRGKSDAYVIAYGSEGNVIAVSQSAERILGRRLENRDVMSMVDPAHTLSGEGEGQSDWESVHQQLPEYTTHINAAGEQISVHARYYPVVTHTGVYTVGVFHTHDGETPQT